jgi:hypothetical protein
LDVTLGPRPNHGDFSVADRFNPESTRRAKDAALLATITGLPPSGRSPVGTPIILGTSLAVPQSPATVACVGFAVHAPDPVDCTYAWSVTKDGSLYAVGAAPSFDFTPDTRGRYFVSLQVTDPASRTSIVNALAIVAEDETPRSDSIRRSQAAASPSRAGLPLRVRRSWQ